MFRLDQKEMSWRHHHLAAFIVIRPPVGHGRQHRPENGSDKTHRIPPQILRHQFRIDARHVGEAMAFPPDIQRQRPPLLADGPPVFAGGRRDRRLQPGQVPMIGTEAEDPAGSQPQTELAVGLVEAERLSRQQIDPAAGRQGEAGCRPADLRFPDILKIGQNQQAVLRFRPGPQQRQGIAAAGLEQFQMGAGLERFMDGQQSLQPPDPFDQVLRGAPVERCGFMHIDLGGGQPFDAVGDPEGAIVAGQGAEAGAQPGPGRRTGGQAAVVVGLGKMDQHPAGQGAAENIGKIPGDLAPVVVLEKLGIGPVEIAAGQQLLHRHDRPAQSLEHEHGVGEFLADPGGDVLPGVQGQHVAGIAAEPVDAMAAPEQEDLGHQPMDSGIVVVELAEIRPDHSPGARRDKRAVRLPDKMLGMVDLFARTPAGMVDRNVDEQAGVPGMDGIGKLEELIHRRRLHVEFGIGRIDIEEIQRRERAAKPAHAGIDGRGRVDRQQLDDPAAQGSGDEIELADDIAESARRRDHRIAAFFQPGDCRRLGGILRPRQAVGAELAREDRVHRAGIAGVGGGNLDGGVAAGRPMQRRIAIGDEKGLGLEDPRLEKRQGEGEMAWRDLPHRQIMPVARQHRHVGLRVPDQFAPPDFRHPEIGAQPCATPPRAGDLERESHAISTVEKQLFAGCRMLSQGSAPLRESSGRTTRSPMLPEWKKPFSQTEKRPFVKMVARAGIEPATQGFSVLCSTN